ncbi:hypothetical protein LPJ59_000046 [Coemansia sp. RSA 2399]|nr:hypothetical protein LPJ59_000046 [Coemansia sp. RSA 2399]KAJ1908544.1 hypothetical protein LPJ81_000045 [Coemansia sp. IMI 209127]
MRQVKSATFHDSDAARDSREKENAHATQSMPNIALALPAASDNAKAYIDRYAADSYSSYGSIESDPEPDSDTEPDLADDTGQAEDHLEENQSPIQQDTAIVLNFEPVALRLPATKIVYNPEPEPTEFLPSRLVRGGTVRKPQREKSSSKKQKQEKSTHGSPPLQQSPLQPPPPQYVLEEDEFNGLLAPGAFADEGQRAQADGGKLRRLLALLAGGNRREREARMFKPTVFDPARKRTEALAEGDDDGTAGMAQEGDSRSKWFCCCPARFCVAFTFAGILVGAVIGFFIWPRVPSLSVSSLTALEPAHVIYDTERNQYGLQMPMRITYEIHSGNFYPLWINGAHVLGFDGVTGNRIVDAKLSSLRVAPLQMQFHSANATVRYVTSDMTDPALTDLFGKCAPRESAAFSDRPAGRPGALTIRFQIKVDVANLGWIGKQPIVTLNQNVECPE